jgi:hypothetical protein
MLTISNITQHNILLLLRCTDNLVGWNERKEGAFKKCAWPSHLECHLQQLFFNDEILKVFLCTTWPLCLTIYVAT